MGQHKWKRTRSPCPDASKKSRSLAAARKQDVAHNKRATRSLIGEKETLENSGEKSCEEEKSGKSATKQSSEEEKVVSVQLSIWVKKKIKLWLVTWVVTRKEQRHDQEDAQSVAVARSSNDTTGGDNSKGTGSLDNNSDPNALSVPECVKIISTEKYGFKTHLNMFRPYDSRTNVRVSFGTQFVEFRKVLIDQRIENSVRKTCSGHFLNLKKDVAVHLPMKLMHGLLLRRFFCEKKMEILCDYNDLHNCFGINEFAIMTGLRCHSLPLLSQQLEKIKEKGTSLVYHFFSYDVTAPLRCCHCWAVFEHFPLFPATSGLHLFQFICCYFVFVHIMAALNLV
ncbi:uncharacterized protein LOC132614561 [Lycium barbarum]|uniref:uncharacterized protein LOC132614561 n=1 Tax=Lycium barbarum TaxID=112863 RepID=UPI00293EB1AD|nr:uncharacterized protein LOC132614561 [Lycium barbarum]